MWRYVLADETGRSIGELRAFNRQYSPTVGGAHTASCRIRQDDDLWNTVQSGFSMLKVYDSGGNLRLYGDVISDQEDAAGQGANVTITASDLSFTLSQRYFAKDPTGVGVNYLAQDSGVIAFDVLSKVNADQATGISAGNTSSYVQRTVTYLFKKALDAITELGGIAGSYEWGLRYVDGVDGAPPTVFLDLLPEWGSDRTGSVYLEYGTGKRNCKTYQRVRTIQTQATRVWALGGGSTLTSQIYDTGAEALYQRRREDVVSAGDITNQALLDALATAQVAVRKDPRVIISLTPFPKLAPKYGVDYVVGDRVSARVVVNGKTRVAGAVRVWGAQIQIDEVGQENATLQLAP